MFQLYKVPKIRAKNHALDSILNELVASKLLMKFERAVSAVNTRADVYIKCLPSSLTQNTTNDWVKQILDQLSLSWPTYVASCSRVVFPSHASRFSSDVIALLETDPYKRSVTIHGFRCAIRSMATCDFHSSLIAAQVRPPRAVRNKRNGRSVDDAGPIISSGSGAIAEESESNTSAVPMRSDLVHAMTSGPSPSSSPSVDSVQSSMRLTTTDQYHLAVHSNDRRQDASQESSSEKVSEGPASTALALTRER